MADDFKKIGTSTYRFADEDLIIVKKLSEGETLISIAGGEKVEMRRIEARLKVLRSMFGCKNSTALVAFFIRNSIIE